MEMLAPLDRLVRGPDRRWSPLGFFPYAAPLGLLALVGMGVGNSQYLTDTRGMHGWWAAVLTLFTVLPIALTGLGRPLMAWRFAYPVMFVGVAQAGPEESWPWAPIQLLAVLVVWVVLTLREDSGVTAWATGLAAVPIFWFAPRANAWGALIGLIVIAVAGDIISRRRQARTALAEQTELTELEKARRAVLEERTRIAREMHDVVAHHMSMIAVQAETAPYRVEGLNEPAREEFRTIAVAARASLTDMRRLLGVLRAEVQETPLAPQPNLADVGALVENASRAGLVVSFPHAESLPVNVPEGVGLAAYRIVQEALANAARHAPGAPVRVSIRSVPAALLVEVGNGPGTSPASGLEVAPVSPVDTGAAPVRGRSMKPRIRGLPRRSSKAAVPGDERAPATSALLQGHGIAGMRERAGALGGTLDAGPQHDGGFLVAARLPLPADPVPREAEGSESMTVADSTTGADSMTVEGS